MMLNLSSSMTQVQSQDCLDLHRTSHKTFKKTFLKKPALSGINWQWKSPCFKMSRWNRKIIIIPIIITNRWQIILTSWTQPLTTPGLTCDSFVLTGASMLAPINSSIRRYFCGITQHKLNQWSHCARQNVKRSDCAHLPIEAKQLANETNYNKQSTTRPWRQQNYSSTLE